MKKIILTMIIIWQVSFSQSFDYVGVAKCKICHSSKKSGNQYDVWLNSSHAKAFATLSSEESKKIAATKGIQNPTQSPECLPCHVTAFTAGKEPVVSVEDGVSCEACHGPGSEYRKMGIMKKINDGSLNGADYGMVTDLGKQCLTCHNPKSPTYKPFDYAEMVKKIAHPIPQ